MRAQLDICEFVLVPVGWGGLNNCSQRPGRYHRQSRERVQLILSREENKEGWMEIPYITDAALGATTHFDNLSRQANDTYSTSTRQK
jgi:hypothetical protein